MVEPKLEPSAQLKNWLSAGCTPSTLAIFSTDRTRRARALKYVIDEISKSGKFRVEHIDCTDLNLDKLRTVEANFKTLSLFSESKIFHFHSMASAKKDLVPFFANLFELSNPQNIVIVTDSPLQKKSPSSVLITKSIKVVTFPELTDQPLIDWVQRESKRLQLTPLPQNVLQELIAGSENDPDEISSRLEKLSLYADSDPVTLQLYQELFPLRLFGNDYKLIEMIVGGDRKQSEYLSTLSLNDKSQPLGLVSLLSKTSSQVAQLKLSHGNSAPAMQPWLLQKYKRLACALQTQVLSRAFISLSSADFRLKDKNLGAQHVFSKLAQIFARR